jgi:uridine phosphorylase
MSDKQEMSVMKFLSDDADDREVFTSSMFVQYAAERRGLRVEDFGVNEVVLLLYSGRVQDRLIKETGAETVVNWLYAESRPLYNFSIDGRKVSLFRPFAGASAAAMYMEELIACGARKFISYGSAGSLQRGVRVGHFVIPTSAVREEGVSYHYLQEEDVPRPDQKVVSALEGACARHGLSYHKGATWTTDAPYREMRSKISRYGGEGILSVEMETSAIFSVGMFRKVRVGSLLIISDELFDDWNPCFHTTEFELSEYKAAKILLEATLRL